MFMELDTLDIVREWELPKGTYHHTFSISGDGNTLGLLVEENPRAYDTIQVELWDIETQTLEGTEWVGATDNLFHPFEYRIQFQINGDATQLTFFEYTGPGTSFYVWDVEDDKGWTSYDEIEMSLGEKTTWHPINSSQLIGRTVYNGIILWDGETNSFEVLIHGTRFMDRGVLDETGQNLWIGGSRFGSNQLYNLHTGERLLDEDLGYLKAWHHETQLGAFYVDRQTIEIQHMETGDLITTIGDGRDSFYDAQFVENGTILAVHVYPNLQAYDDEDLNRWDTVRFYDVQSGEVVIRFRGNGGPTTRYRLRILQSKYLAGMRGYYAIQEILAQDVFHEWDYYDDTEWLSGEVLAMSSDERVVATTFFPDDKPNGSGIRVFDATTQELLYEFTDHDGEVLSLSFNVNSTILASASGSGSYSGGENSVRLWDMTTGESLGVLDIFDQGYMREVIFTSGGKTLIIIMGGCPCEGYGFDSYVKLWGIPLDD